MKSDEDLFANKIASYLEKEPVVSQDISTRLEFARNMALKNMKKPQVVEVVIAKKRFSFDFFKNKMVWGSGAAAALALMVVVSTVEMSSVTQSSSYNDEITYHMEADNLPPDILNDEL